MATDSLLKQSGSIPQELKLKHRLTPERIFQPKPRRTTTEPTRTKTLGVKRIVNTLLM